MFGSNDPDNPMGGLLGDLLKVIGSGPGRGDSWFEAARTLAFGVATDGGVDEQPDPLVRIAFEELARVAELHVADATGIPPSAAGPQVSFDAVGPGQWSFAVLQAYRPVLKSMVEAQQQGAAAVPTSLDVTELGPDVANGAGAKVVTVQASGPAAGRLLSGQVILAVNSQPVRTMAELRARLYVLSPGTPVSVLVQGPSGPHVVSVTLSASS